MREVPLTQGFVAFVDDADYEYVSQFTWQAFRDHNVWYARHVPFEDSVKAGPIVLMHRLITQAPVGTQVDHRNRNGLDNQRHNLRVTTHARNAQNQTLARNNTSGYKGVSRYRNRWVARIAVNKQRLLLGYFSTPEEAAVAYDEAARLHFGEFARVNFPRQGESGVHEDPVSPMRRSQFRSAGRVKGRAGVYRGVTRQPNGRWCMRCIKGNTVVERGTFSTPEEAARAYDAAAMKHHGQTAHLNFPEEATASPSPWLRN